MGIALGATPFPCWLRCCEEGGRLANQDATVREHQFYVAIAKYVFGHPEHGIVFVREPISLQAASGYGLTPLILYGVTAAGTPISWLTFSREDKPRSFCDVLQEAWRRAPGLLGYPDTLKVNRHVAKASPDLRAKLAKVGVNVVIADGQDKQFSSSLRSAQNNAMWLSLGIGTPSITTVELLAMAAEYCHRSDVEFKRWESSNKDIAERANAWVKLPRRDVAADLPMELDWVRGPWLSVWEASLPPSSHSYFHADSDGCHWLLLGNPPAEADPEDPESVDLITDEDYEYEAREIVKLMLASWPGKEIEVAREIGVTAQRLKWYISNHAPLTSNALGRLLNLLGIEMSGDGFYEPKGPCVLVARSQKIADAYESLSHGGDIDLSFEALPENTASADPSWRFVIFQACGELPCIIMFPRGTVIAERVNSGLFINFGGHQVVSMATYRDIVATCARACTSPSANRREMEAFIKRRSDYIQRFSTWGS